MIEIFSELSRKAIEFSRDEAVRLRHDYIGTEHMLLGLIRGGPNRVTKILEDASIQLDELILEIEDVTQPSNTSSLIMGQLPLTARTKKCLELALQEARTLQSKEIEPEHILLALLKEEEGVAAQVLSLFDFDYKTAYEGLTGTPKIAAEGTSFPISPAVRDILEHAKAEAVKLRKSYLGVSLLFLGLLKLESDPATLWLANSGVDFNKVKAELEDQLLPDENTKIHVNLRTLSLHVGQPIVAPRRMPINTAYQRTLLLALKEAQTQGLQEITPMCILLAILRVPDNLPTEVLTRHNIKYEMLKSMHPTV
ncbi:MAG: Clp protease N-terminal domain-containing protein [Patescibacteria group bacterium]|jgi:ATP-dependent Clp protease ATP-binding subunit ClpA